MAGEKEITTRYLFTTKTKFNSTPVLMAVLSGNSQTWHPFFLGCINWPFVITAKVISRRRSVYKCFTLWIAETLSDKCEVAKKCKWWGKLKTFVNSSVNLVASTGLTFQGQPLRESVASPPTPDCKKALDNVLAKGVTEVAVVLWTTKAMPMLWLRKLAWFWNRLDWKLVPRGNLKRRRASRRFTNWV